MKLKVNFKVDTEGKFKSLKVSWIPETKKNPERSQEDLLQIKEDLWEIIGLLWNVVWLEELVRKLGSITR